MKPDKIVCLGCRPGEILPPYKFSIEEYVKKVYEHIEMNKEIERYKTALDFMVNLNDYTLSNVRTMAFMGAWADQCVSISVVASLRKGINCLVDPELIVLPFMPQSKEDRVQKLSDAVSEFFVKFNRLKEFSLFQGYKFAKLDDYVMFTPNL